VPGAQTVVDGAVRIAVANAINLVFIIAFVAALLGLGSTLFSPRQELTEASKEREPILTSAD
jgi:hypothetical protein